MAENGILFFETRGHVDNKHPNVLDTLPHITRFRIYDLRHTFATRQVHAGTDLPTLAALMGHANIKETMRYAHPSDLHKSAAMGRMDEERMIMGAGTSPKSSVKCIEGALWWAQCLFSHKRGLHVMPIFINRNADR